MKVKVTLKQGYNEIVLVFRGWQTAQEWAEEALLSGENVKVTMEEEPEAEVQLPFDDVCAIDDDAEIERVLR